MAYKKLHQFVKLMTYKKFIAIYIDQFLVTTISIVFQLHGFYLQMTLLTAW